MQKPEKTILNGTVEDIVYQNNQNDYTVIDVATNDGDLVTAVGIMPYVCEGEEVKLYGEWVSHAEYGKQFSVENYEKKLPTDLSSILKYLSSKQVKGIGPATAVKIVNKYGKDTFDVIEKHPEWLVDIPGITMKKAAAISESFVKMSGIRELMMFCNGYFGTQTVNKIYNQFGAVAVGLIKENPYRLCDEIFGVGFEKADEIALSLGIEKNSDIRIDSAIKYVLGSAVGNSGHTCLPYDMLCEKVTAQIAVNQDKIKGRIDEMSRIGILSLYRLSDKCFVYLSDMRSAEIYIAKKLLQIDRTAERFSITDVEILLSRVEAEYNIEYADMQRRAVFEAFRGGVMVITGGPGTGKTTVVRAILRICQSAGLKTALAAPTGRAAKRLSESTCEDARTIHRLLEVERTDSSVPKFNRNDINPLDEDVIIIDEASMIDITLCNALLKAVKNGTRIIFIGDCDQLPPVGAGNVLQDMIASEKFTTIKLNKIFRQSDKSLIIRNAHEINHGNMPILDSKNNDFFFLEREYEESISSTVISLVAKRLPNSYGESIKDGIQVISPSKKGVAGTDSLNIELQNAVNAACDGKNEIRIGNRAFREGDRVMQIRNNYEIKWKKHGIESSGIFNGDIGIIQKINTNLKTVEILFDDRCAVYDYEQFEDIDLAYAITVHKSQGSEYPCVIIPLYSAPSMLLTRNMIYTAVTRAKKLVILVGRRDILKQMVDNNYRTVRYSNLKSELEKQNLIIC